MKPVGTAKCVFLFRLFRLTLIPTPGVSTFVVPSVAIMKALPGFPATARSIRIAGTITGLEGMQQGVGLDIVPSMLLRQDRVIGPNGMTEHNLEPQLDVFYKITPQLNASLTLNTDFSAAEVDSEQVNLTRFSTFFFERRDFFIRDSDIF